MCSCTHGEVRCAPRPCPPLMCGYQELEFIPEGSCCPVCVGSGSEYEPVERDPLCLWGLPGDTFSFLPSVWLKDPWPHSLLEPSHSLALGRKWCCKPWGWNKSLSSIPNSGCWGSLIYYFVLARCNLLCSQLLKRKGGRTRSFDMIP